MLTELEEWMKMHHYSSIDAFRGRILIGKAVTNAFERIQFMRKNPGF
jgi:hypothetical protein